MKPLFITIDTEGDLLWEYSKNITTNNVLAIPRFQALCENYNYVPIWLTDYEMIQDERFVEYVKEKANNGLCEIGIHVHAQNNPPYYKLDRVNQEGELLIEYPYDIMLKKICYLKDCIEKKIGIPVKTHRAGRWALDEKYIKCLIEAGIQFDCSVTPGMNWYSFCGATKDSHGIDYSNASRNRQILNARLIEYPVSIMQHTKFFFPDKLGIMTILKEIIHKMKNDKIWLRPTGNNLKQMKYMLREIASHPNEKFAEFMIHSSELMLGTSHLYSSKKECDRFYHDIEELFKYANELGFYGTTFELYEKKLKGEN